MGHREHFAYVQKLKLVFKTRGRGLLYLNEDAASFLEDAVYGQLPAVSWIDPNFKDFNLIGSPPNDDHPPSDVTHGQELALLVYNALATGPLWDRTLLLVFYDEHGGSLTTSRRLRGRPMTTRQRSQATECGFQRS